MIPISVIIVSFNTADLLRRCLNSLSDVAEIIVIDNNSHDGSPEMVRAEFPNVILIRNETNRGFGPANNQGLAIATHEIVLLLNSDAAAEPGGIQTLLDEFKDSKVIAAGGSLKVPATGKIHPSACNRLTVWRVFCEQFFLENLGGYWIETTERREVSQVMGACLMMRNVATFDERFPLYCEDTELCHRLLAMGKIIYQPNARFIHELGGSSLQTRWKSVALYNRGKELYFKIHHGRLARVVVWVINRKGAALRMLAHAVLLRKEKVKLFWKVLTAPLRGPEL